MTFHVRIMDNKAKNVRTDRGGFTAEDLCHLDGFPTVLVVFLQSIDKLEHAYLMIDGVSYVITKELPK